MKQFKRFRGGAIWLMLIVTIAVVWIAVVNGGSDSVDKPLTSVAADIQAGEVAKLVQAEDSNSVRVVYKDSRTTDAVTRLPPNTNIIEALEGFGVDPSSVTIEVSPGSRWGAWLSVLTLLLPILFLVGIVLAVPVIVGLNDRGTGENGKPRVSKRAGHALLRKAGTFGTNHHFLGFAAGNHQAPNHHAVTSINKTSRGNILQTRNARVINLEDFHEANTR